MKIIQIVLAVSIVSISALASAEFNTNSLDKPHVPGELLIKFKGSSYFNRIETLDQLELFNAHKIKSLTKEGLELYKFPNEEALTKAAIKIQTSQDVEYVELNHYHYLQSTPNDPSFDLQYGLDNSNGADISAKSAWSITKGSRRVVVGVIDTGIDYRHKDLRSNIWTNSGETGKDSRGRDKRTNGVDDDKNGYVDDYRGWDFYSNDNDPMDRHKHGTHVAGIIGATGNNKRGITGVSWYVSMAALKVFSDSGGRTRTDALVSAIRYAADMGIPISNNSWGSTSYSRSIKDAVSHANSKGHLFIAAAGNDGTNNDRRTFYPAGYTFSNVISVGASDSNDRLASFSNYGSTVDIAAPGVGIYSTLPDGRYGYLSGTSMAAPFVAGAAALVKARSSRSSVSSIKRKLIQGSDRVSSLNGRISGNKRLNAHRALR